MYLLNALLILSMNGLSLENQNEVLKIIEKLLANYESLDHWKSRIGEQYSTNKKKDVEIETVTDLNMEEIQQNKEAALENLEQEHNKQYAQTNFESGESCTSDKNEDGH